MSATSHLLLERANRSISLGALQAQILAGLVGPIGVVYLLWHQRPIPWILSALVAGLCLLLIVWVRRLGTLRLTPVGIEGGHLKQPMRWDSVVQVVMTSGQVLNLYDSSGRAVSLKRAFLTSGRAVIDAVEKHLPPDVPIQVFRLWKLAPYR
jgi:hypothetical protein